MSTNSHKLIISKVEEKKHSFINNNIWCADLVYMELRSNITKEFNFYCFIYIYSRYETERDITITNLFQDILDLSGCCGAKPEGL